MVGAVAFTTLVAAAVVTVAVLATVAEKTTSAPVMSMASLTLAIGLLTFLQASQLTIVTMSSTGNICALHGPM